MPRSCHDVTSHGRGHALMNAISLASHRRRNRGSTGALAPAMLKRRGRKYLFAPAIICQVLERNQSINQYYLLVDSQSSLSLYAFKILNLNLIRPMYSQLGIWYIFLKELCEACKHIKLYTYIGGLHTYIGGLHTYIGGLHTYIGGLHTYIGGLHT